MMTSLPPLAPPSVNEAIWAETQSVLRPQMTRATYDTIIQGTMLLGRENGNYVVGVQTEMAKEWLENRLRDIVRRALSSVIGVTVNVEFRLIDANK
jgi:chromosomal replication initiation ATPase DnaA